MATVDIAIGGDSCQSVPGLASTKCGERAPPSSAGALISNIAFLVYGIGLDLVPVWLLHSILGDRDQFAAEHGGGDIPSG